MPERDDDPRLGAVSGLVAGVMVIALTAMAFKALPAHEPPMRVAADLSVPDVDLPQPSLTQGAD